MKLYGLFNWGWDEAKSVPITSKEVMEVYFKAYLEAIKFCNVSPAFLSLLQELFKGVLAIGSYIKLINKLIKSCIDSKLLLMGALQAPDLVDKEAEDKENEEKVNKAFKLKLAYSSIKGR